MYGAYIAQLGTYIRETFGDEAASQIREASGIGLKIYMPAQIYEDNEMTDQIEAIVTVTGRKRDDILAGFGEFIVPTMFEIYWAYFDPSWKTLDVLENFSSLFERIRRSHDNLPHPEFIFERISKEKIAMTYSSPRNMCALAKGIVLGFAKHYGEDIRIIKTSCRLNGDPACHMIIQLNAVETQPETEEAAIAV